MTSQNRISRQTALVSWHFRGSKEPAVGWSCSEEQIEDIVILYSICGSAADIAIGESQGLFSVRSKGRRCCNKWKPYLDMEALLDFVIANGPCCSRSGEQQLECGIVAAKSACEWSMSYYRPSRVSRFLRDNRRSVVEIVDYARQRIGNETEGIGEMEALHSYPNLLYLGMLLPWSDSREIGQVPQGLPSFFADQTRYASHHKYYLAQLAPTYDVKGHLPIFHMVATRSLVH